MSLTFECFICGKEMRKPSANILIKKALRKTSYDDVWGVVCKDCHLKASKMAEPILEWGDEHDTKN